MVSLNDLADRPPVPMADGQVLELAQHRVRHIDTPHVPHAWEARVLYEETTRTLLCGDLFTQLFGASCLTPQAGPTIRKLAELAPATLAVMHGSSFTGDAGTALHALADDYDARLSALTDI